MIRIRPQSKNREQWMRIAKQEDLFYEVKELSVPPMLGGDAEDVRRCTDWYGADGKVKALHGAFIGVDPASGDPMIASISRQRCRESCELAAELGAEQVIFHTGAHPFQRGKSLESWAQLCGGFYAKLAQEYRHLTICIENSSDLDPEPLELLVRYANQRVKICLDIGHAQYSGTPLDVWFSRLGDYIGCLHLSDNRGRFYDHLPLGEGAVNWIEADRLYKQIGREIPLTIEADTVTDVIESLKFLRRNRYFGVRR